MDSNSSSKPKRRVSFSDEIDNTTSNITSNSMKSMTGSIDYNTLDPIEHGVMINIEALYRSNESDKYELKKEYDNKYNQQQQRQQQQSTISNSTNSNSNSNSSTNSNSSNIAFNFTNLHNDGIYDIEWIDTNQSLGIMLEEEDDGGMTLIMIKGVAPGYESSIIEKSIQKNDILIMINDISMVFHGFSFVQKTIQECKKAKEKLVLSFLRTSVVSLESFLKKELEFETESPKYNAPIELIIEQIDNTPLPNSNSSPVIANKITNDYNNNNDKEIINIKDYIVKNIDRLNASEIDDLKKLLDEVAQKSTASTSASSSTIKETSNKLQRSTKLYDDDNDQNTADNSSKLLDNAQRKMTDFNASYNYDNDLLDSSDIPSTVNKSITVSKNDGNGVKNENLILPPIIDSSTKGSNKSIPQSLKVSDNEIAIVNSYKQESVIEPQTESEEGIDRDNVLLLPIIRTPSIKVREPDFNSDLMSVSSVHSNHSTSTQSVIPFPFTSHPTLPHVDKYIKDEKLTMEYMKKAVSQEKDQKSRRVKAKKRSKKADRNVQESGDEDYLFSESDIYTLMVYFQSFCDDSNPDGINQEISLPDMEAAFRKYKQATISLEDEMYARELMVSFEWLLEENNLTPLEWFSLADVKGAIGGDGKLTYVELVDGLNKLCDLTQVPTWREVDIFKLLKYMDPSADGDLTAAEVKLAFKRYYMPPESKTILERAGPIIQKLEWYLQTQRLRVRDLFTRIDVDGSMSISMAELSEAMRKIIGKRPQKTNKEKKNHFLHRSNEANESNSIYDYSDDDASVASDLSVSDMSVSSLGESVYSNFSLNRGYKNNVYDGIPTRSFAHNRKFLNMPSLNAIPITREIDKKKIRAGDLLPENNLDIVIEARKIVEVRDDTPNYLKPEVSQSVNVLATFNIATGVYSPISVKLKPAINTPKIDKYCKEYQKKHEVQDKFANYVQTTLKRITHNINIA